LKYTIEGWYSNALEPVPTDGSVFCGAFINDDATITIDVNQIYFFVEFQFIANDGFNRFDEIQYTRK
jgi:hypothetical protein